MYKLLEVFGTLDTFVWVNLQRALEPSLPRGLLHFYAAPTGELTTITRFFNGIRNV